MNSKEELTKREKERIPVKDSKGAEVLITGVQDDVQVMFNNARANTRTALFYWGMVKEETPKDWNIIYKNKAYMPYKTSKKIDGVALTRDQLYRFNTIATLKYTPLAIDYLKSDYVKTDKADILDKETGETYFDKELKDLWAEAIKDATYDMEDILWAKQLEGGAAQRK